MPSPVAMQREAGAQPAAFAWDDPEMPLRLDDPDPVAARIMRHYRKSIRELTDIGGQTDQTGRPRPSQRANENLFRDPLGKSEANDALRACPALDRRCQSA